MEVRVIDYKQRKNEDGEQFYVLILQGGVELVKSKETGKFYATAKKASMSCTFNEETCQSLIGTTFPGSIKREECDEYEYTTDQGEVLQLSHRWVYVDNVQETIEQVMVNATAVI